MKRARWRNRVGLPFLLMSALLSTVVTPAAMSAGLRPAAGPGVDCRNATPSAVARAALARSGERQLGARVQPQLAERGELTGRVLSAQTATGAAVSIALPVESFVAPTVGDLVLYTRFSARTGSEVRAVNLANGCDIRLAAPAEIARSALLDRAANHVYVHSVTRAGRVDAGVTRHDLASGAGVQVLERARPPLDLGPIFGTDLRWSVAGDRLAVQSCGFSRCLTRVLDVATREVATYDTPGQGAFVGLTSRHLVTLAQCPGLPCAVLSTNLATGSVSTLASEAFSAHLTPSGTGAAVVSIATTAGVVEVIQ